jgi:hypothetical protein
MPKIIAAWLTLTVTMLGSLSSSTAVRFGLAVLDFLGVSVSCLISVVFIE